MLIAFTAEGLDLNSPIAERFGKTSYIIFYDTVKNSYESVRNPYINICGGAGIQTAQLIIEKNVSAVITTEMGMNAFRFLKSAGIDVYYSSKEQVTEAVKKFIDGKLALINQDSLQIIERRNRRRRYRGSKY